MSALVTRIKPPRLSSLLLPIYCKSHFSTSSGESPEQWLQNLNVKTLPVKTFSFQFDRSSGPGGQKVNKCNSKCTMTIFSFSTCSWVPQEISDQLRAKKFRFWAKSKDSIVIQSDGSRSRETNKQLCLEKFVNEVKATCWFEKPPTNESVRRWDTIRSKARETRLRDKKFQTDKKRLRRKDEF
ncbi:LADA_0C12178g1_1 [Lachancea dasiensis]|uniref:LADA_0C12178g1_1 n=1 Tax=Lachancea dasiensis TaxID=1072105 RepID=A0A1G4J2B0_9SACH|nr:LADA_0C12178g1_1 [Lachancea dasiensis]